MASSRQRSPAYPAIPLEQAVELVGKVRHGLGGGDVTREQIAPQIGHEKATGPANTKIAAMAHFGLLEKGKGAYRVSELATRILTPISDQEKTDAIRQAALRPTIFASIYQKYVPEGKLPAALESVLQREYSVTPAAAKTIRDNLIATLTYAGLMEDDTLRFTRDNIDSAEMLSEKFSGNGPAQHKTDISTPTNSGSQIYEMPMSFGTAKIVLPSRITIKDFDALKSLLDLVRHFISDEEADDTSAVAEKD